MKYAIAIVVTVEAPGPQRALEQAQALQRLLADPFVQSAVRSEGVDARGIEVKAPVEISPANGTSRSSGA